MGAERFIRTTCYKMINHISAAFFFLTYAAPILLAYRLASSGWRPSLTELVSLFVETFCIIGGCMSVCLHRYCAHRAFKVSRFVQAVIVVGGCFAYQGNPIWWASKHLRHHQHCDLPEDPHSWRQTSFLYAWIGWTMNPDEMSIDSKQVKFLSSHRELQVIGFLWWMWPLLVAVMVHVQWGVAPVVLYVTTPMLLARMVTLLFNVEYHPPHRSSRFDACRALDIPRILGDCVGESCHADHHTHPMRAKRPSGGFPHADLPYWLAIKPLLLVGLAWSPADNFEAPLQHTRMD